jgi:hypothetical protein
VFTPIPPQANEPAPEPQDEPNEDDAAGEEPDAEPPDVAMPPLHGPARWPAVVRWSRLCRVLAFVSLICFGWGAASNLYEALNTEPQFGPFIQPRATPGWYLTYSLLCVVSGITSCISLLGFAELLHLLMAIEAKSRRSRHRSRRRDGPDTA